MLFIKYDYKIIKLLNKHARIYLSKWVLSCWGCYLGRLSTYSTSAAIAQSILELLFWHGLQRLRHILLILSSMMGNLRPLRVDLIFGTAKSHLEPRLMNKVSDQGRWYHLASETRYDYKVMRLVFLVLLIKWLWRQVQKRSSKNILSDGNIFGFSIQ